MQTSQPVVIGCVCELPVSMTWSEGEKELTKSLFVGRAGNILRITGVFSSERVNVVS